MALERAKVQTSRRFVPVAPSVLTSSAVGVEELEVRGSEAKGVGRGGGVAKPKRGANRRQHPYQRPRFPSAG